MHATDLAPPRFHVQIPRVIRPFFLAGAALFAALALLNAGFEWLTEDTIEESGKSAEVMAEKTFLPFSKSTRDIHYFFFAGGMQDLERYIKFRCNAGDTDSVVEDFLAQNQRDLSGLKPPPPRVKTAPPFGLIGSSRFPQISWWDLGSSPIIREVQIDTSYGYHIWVARLDAITNEVYVYQND